MERRDLSLSARVEEVRDPQPSQVVHFELTDIKLHFDESLTAIKNQFSITDALAENGKDNECKTIWRSQIVLLEGILDFYIHEISKYALYKMFSGDWQSSEKYGSISVPMREVEKAFEAEDTKEWFFEFVNNCLSRDVFLSADSMKDQLNLIGIGFGTTMEKAFPKATVNESHHYGRSIVQALFERRNAIAHQVDRKHTTAEQTDIDRVFVEERISEVEAIVTAIQEIAEANG